MLLAFIISISFCTHSSNLVIGLKSVSTTLCQMANYESHSYRRSTIFLMRQICVIIIDKSLVVLLTINLRKIRILSRSLSESISLPPLYLQQPVSIGQVYLSQAGRLDQTLSYSHIAPSLLPFFPRLT